MDPMATTVLILIWRARSSRQPPQLIRSVLVSELFKALSRLVARRPQLSKLILKRSSNRVSNRRCLAKWDVTLWDLALWEEQWEE